MEKEAGDELKDRPKVITGTKQVFIDTRQKITVVDNYSHEQVKMLKAYTSRRPYRIRFVNFEILKDIHPELAKDVIEVMELEDFVASERMEQ